ncbi:MAG: hypothetical protein CSA66_03505 [Proteobacteria bacterium]|nr:MAG: hypothetical protein CSA66_03505 [Pseudomonadota bacterium]
MEDAQYGCRELKPSDHERIARFIRGAPRDATLYLRPVIEDLGSFGGWWFGGLAGGTDLQALLCIDNHAAEIYGSDRDALHAVGAALRKMQELSSGAGAHRHQLSGEASSVAPIWQALKSLKGRTLVADRFRRLMAAGEPPDKPPSKRIRLGYATPKDLRTIYELTADRRLELHHLDPRRANPAAHRARCEAAIRDKRQLLGRDGDKPVFVAELKPTPDGRVLLDEVHVPQAFRSRKRLIGGALHLARKAPAARDKDLLFFAEDDAMAAAAEMANYELRTTYRHVITVG